MNHEAVCRTAPATPGLSMTVVTEVVIMTSFSKKHLNTLTTDHSQGSYSQLLRCFFWITKIIFKNFRFFEKKVPFQIFLDFFLRIGLDWRALVESRSPNIENQRGFLKL